jgi:membrane protease YdiL (CAAX protease family)
MMHIQYEPFYLLVIFGLGLIFGWLRWRANSTTLTIILHGVVNLIALLQTAFAAGWAD